MTYQTDLFDPAPVKHFHNTVPLHGKELIEANKKAQSQQDKVYELLKKSPKGLTRKEVWLIFGQQFTESSCGRCLSNLADDPQSRVVKTSERRKGLYGSPNSVYKIV